MIDWNTQEEDYSIKLEDLHHEVDIEEDKANVIPISEDELMRAGNMPGCAIPQDTNLQSEVKTVEDYSIKLEDLHHEVDIEEDKANVIPIYEEELMQEGNMSDCSIPQDTNFQSEVKTEEDCSIKLEDLHHEVDIEEDKPNVIPIYEDELMQEGNMSDCSIPQDTNFQSEPKTEEDYSIKLEDLHHEVDIEEDKANVIPIPEDELMRAGNMPGCAIPQDTNLQSEVKTEEDYSIKLEDLHHEVDIEEDKTNVIPISEDEQMRAENRYNCAIPQDTNFQNGVRTEVDWSQTLQVENLDEEDNMEELSTSSDDCSDEKENTVTVVSNNSETEDEIMKEDNILKKATNQVEGEKLHSNLKIIKQNRKTNNSLCSLIPEKSRHLYEKQFKKFEDWRRENNIEIISENVLLAYFEMQRKNYRSPTLWSMYSMIRCCLNVYKNIDISKFYKLPALLKRTSTGYIPKKSKNFESDDINKFINTADDNIYLAMKVGAIYFVIDVVYPRCNYC